MIMAARRRGLVAGTMCLALLAGAAGAQEAPPRAQPLKSVQPVPPRPPQGPTFSVSFSGGTLEQYVKALREAATEPVNVSLSQELTKLPVPAAELQQVTSFTAMKTLENLSFPNGQRLSVEVLQDEGSKPVYAIAFQIRPNLHPVMASDRSERMIQSIANLVGKENGEAASKERLDTVLSAVEAALRLGRPSEIPMPDVAIHSESNLLMVMGSQEDRLTVQSVLQQMAATSMVGEGSASSRDFDLVSISAAEAQRAVREMLAGGQVIGGQGVHVKIESEKKLRVTAARSPMLRVEGLIAYLDQERGTPPKEVELRSRLELREAMVNEQLDGMRRQLAQQDALAQQVKSSLNEREQQLASAQAKLDAVVRELMEARQEASALRRELHETQRPRGGEEGKAQPERR